MSRKTSALRAAKPPTFQYRRRTHDLPASQGMLHLVRQELKAEMKSGFAEMRSRFGQLDSRFSDIDSRFSQIDSRFEQIDSKLEKVAAAVAQIGVMVEEQNSRNRVALEGLTGLWERQQRVESRMDGVEDWMRSLGRGRS